MAETEEDLRVLVVDDDFMIATMHAELVDQTDGFVCVGQAGSGVQALALIREKSPELLLLDVHLPDMSGLKVLRTVREDGIDVDAIVVTAERDASFVKEALRGGASQYLVKPFDLDELQARILGYAASQTFEGRVDQAGIDVAFSRAAMHVASKPNAPKGLSPESVRLVSDALAEHGELSATSCGEITGMARVTVRRYLEHCVEAGWATVRLKYGAGRPERLYSPTGLIPRD